MLEVMPHLLVAMPSRCDMEIPLHLISLHTPIHPTSILILSPSQLRSARPLPPRPRLPQILVHILLIPILLELLPDERGTRKSLFMPPLPGLPIHYHAPMPPLREISGVRVQALARDDAVPGGVLDVYAQVGALHGDDDVEVQLQIVGDALFDAEGVGRVALHPAPELGDGEPGAEGEEEDRPGGAIAGLLEVVVLCFGWEEGC